MESLRYSTSLSNVYEGLTLELDLLDDFLEEGSWSLLKVIEVSKAEVDVDVDA